MKIWIRRKIGEGTAADVEKARIWGCSDNIGQKLPVALTSFASRGLLLNVTTKTLAPFAFRETGKGLSQ